MKFAAKTQDGRFTGAIYDAVTADIRAHHAAFGEQLVLVKGLIMPEGDDDFSFTPEVMTVAEQREAAMSAVQSWIDTFTAQFTAGVPPVEIASWPTKALAAKAHLAGQAQAMIEAEAQLTGEDPDDLAATINGKANLYTTIIAQMTGLRRMASQAISAANTSAQVADALDEALASANTILADLGLSQES